MAFLVARVAVGVAVSAHNSSVEKDHSKKAVYDYLLDCCEPELALQLKPKLYKKIKKELDDSFMKEVTPKNVRKKLQEPAARQFVREHLHQLETLKMEAQLAGICIDGWVCRTSVPDRKGLTSERDKKVPLGACGIVVGFTIASREMELYINNHDVWSIEVSFPGGKYGPHAGLIRSIRQFKFERKWPFYRLSTRKQRA